MNFRSIIYFLTLVLASALFVSCGSDSLEGKLIITLVKPGKPVQDMLTGENWRYLEGASIAMLDADKPGKVRILTGEFYSACSPYVSWDGKYLLFAAQQKKEDTWQIWEMKFSGLEFRKITDFKENCTDPVYMPTDRIVFSRSISDSITGASYGLFSCNKDGSDIRQITYHPHTDFASSVMADGRLLTITRQMFPEIKDQMIMVVRPDGTKADFFYQSDNSQIFSRVKEDEVHGKLYFIEKSDAEKDIISIDYNRPGDSRINLSAEAGGEFVDIFPADNNKLIVAWKDNAATNSALYEFDVRSGKKGKLIFSSEKTEVADITMVKNRQRPKKLPSEVDMGVKTGQVMCQDINFTGTGISHNSQIAMLADKVEILGVDSVLGIVSVESDGSVYLKIKADEPFRFRTLDKNNKIVNGPGMWLWIRPNERRGCIGCHEDRNLAPANNVPLAVKKAPVNIPMEVSGIIEKKVELE